MRAQVVSSVADLPVCRLKIARRLGVSPAPVALNGPVTTSVGHAARRGEGRVGAEVGVDLVNACAALTIDQRDARCACGPAVTFIRKLRGLSTLTCSPSSVRSTPARPTAASAERELVFRIERERVVEHDAAARAERQPVDVAVLREPAGGANVVCNGASVRSPTARRLIFIAAET